MKPPIKLMIPMLLLTIITYAHTGDLNRSVIDQIKITKEDIPSGFVMGKIPDFAKSTFRDNPCFLDRNGIKKIARHLYPDGSYGTISQIHATIIARNDRPYGDDLVCYIILYNDAKTAEKEVSKLTNYVEANNQRAVVTVKENLAVFIHADDQTNMPAVIQLQRTIEERIGKAVPGQ